KSAPAWDGPRLSLETRLLLALRGARRRCLHRMPGGVADPGRTGRARLDHRAHHPEFTPRVPRKYIALHPEFPGSKSRELRYTPIPERKGEYAKDPHSGTTGRPCLGPGCARIHRHL